MKAWDFRVVQYNGAELCVECLPDDVSVESEDVMPIFATAEVDRYPVCDQCGREHDYMGLTEFGQLEIARGTPVEPDRCDLVEANYVHAVQFGEYALLHRLTSRLQYSPGVTLRDIASPGCLSDNGRAIYVRLQPTGPGDPKRPIATS